MIALTKTEQTAAAIVASAIRIRDAVAALQAQVDPTAQARIDAVCVVLEDAATVLRGILPSGTEEPPPPPPPGPPA